MSTFTNVKLWDRVGMETEIVGTRWYEKRSAGDWVGMETEAVGTGNEWVHSRGWFR